MVYIKVSGVRINYILLVGNINRFNLKRRPNNHQSKPLPIFFYIENKNRLGGIRSYTIQYGINNYKL